MRDAVRDASTDEQIAVPTALFAALCSAKETDAHILVADLPEADRARLALFCNSRSHLRGVGRAIAYTCSLSALTLEGGTAGQFLFEQAGQDRPSKKRISLGGSQRRLQPTWQSGRPID